MSAATFSNLRFERFSDETRPGDDPALAVPDEIFQQLIVGARPPHRAHQATGVYYYFAHEPSKSKKKVPLIPHTRLKFWTERDGFDAVDELLPRASSPSFDLEARRILVTTYRIDGSIVNDLREIDLETRQVRLLEIEARDKLPPRLFGPARLADGRIIITASASGMEPGTAKVYVLEPKGDRWAPTFEMPQDGHYCVVRRKLLVTGKAAWEAGKDAFVQRADFGPAGGFCTDTFDGRILRYTEAGCDRLIGLD